MAVAVMAIAANAQMRFGIKTGLNFSNASAKFGGEKIDDIKMRFGGQFGVLAQFELTENLALQPEVMYSTMGYKVEEEGAATKTKLNYLQIPVNVMYKFGSGSAKPYITVGPYIGYALNGKYETEPLDDLLDEYNFKQLYVEPEKADIKFGDEFGEMKRLDFGVGIGAGVELEHFQFGVNYSLGLANIMGGGDSDNSIKNSLFSVSAAFLF